MIVTVANLFNDSREDFRGKVIAVCVLLFIFNAAAWLWAVAAFHNYPVLLGTAALAYSFGLRHAFDADHIAAIDNVTRKLMQEGRRPVGVGFFFSLGHSTIVVALTARHRHRGDGAADRFDAFKSFGGVVGTLVSALFLFAIAVANILVLVSVWRTFRTVKSGGRFVEEDLDLALANRGLLGRLFRRFFRMIERSWQMYPLGVLFGLGFDTATEVGLLGISATPGLAGPVDLVDPGLPGAVHRRHDPDRHDRQHPDARRLWLGLRQADPQALLQSHHHCRFGRGRGDRRRPRGART